MLLHYPILISFNAFYFIISKDRQSVQMVVFFSFFENSAKISIVQVITHSRKYKHHARLKNKSP